MSNATVPSDGVPLPGETATTLAVNVTVWSVTAFGAEVETEVVVDATVTFWVRGEEPDAS